MVEATFLLPLTILLMVALIGLAIQFLTDYKEQVETHRAQTEELYQDKETDHLRLMDTLGA